MMRYPVRGNAFYCLILTFLFTTISCRSENTGSPSVHALLGQFKTNQVFVHQYDLAIQIAAFQDPGVLHELEGWLSHADRHIRANTAFIFASLGDDRGIESLQEILTDQSPRPLAQGTAMGNSLKAQIKADRYYAVHMLGVLKDKRATPMLIPLLKDSDINYKVAWALGEIGDAMAIAPLTAALADKDPNVKVIAMDSLVKLQARSAIPQIRILLKDPGKSSYGEQVSVAQAARQAINQLEKEP